MDFHTSDLPEFLYKYRKGDELDIDTLKRFNIYVPDLKEVNDIFETEFNTELELALGHQNIKPLFIQHNDLGDPMFVPFMMSLGVAPDKTEDRRRILAEEIENTKDEIKKTGVYCLTSNPINQKMWGLYADSSKGYCIKYKIKEPTQPRNFFSFGQITYLASPPLINWGLKNHYLPGRVLQLMVGHKSEKWTDEDEWRLIYEKAGTQLFPFKIASIIFGANAEKKLIDDIKNIFKDTVKYEVAIPKSGTYELVILDETQ